MKYIAILLLLTPLVFSASVADLDPEDNLNEDEFEEYFHLPLVTDPEEHERREEALKENEALIKENNEKYMEGIVSWWDAVNEFADLPADEFEEQKTGATDGVFYGRGLLQPSEEERVDERSERYFDRFRYSRAAVPSSYSSVDLGLVSPVKAQKSCGSCSAFSNMAMVETCFKKVTGVFGDYSEQQFVDCGYGKYGANGCNGAPIFSYVKWAAKSGESLTHESTYPYLNTNPKLTCPANLKAYNQGAKVTDSYYSYKGDEETLKKLVHEHGAVVTAVKAEGPFQDYSGGIFAGCPKSDSTDHAVTVVGYGTEGGQDYWLIKNSWGSSWGEKGFIRLKRGVGMCGIGKELATVTCASTSGPTDAPMTTQEPCEDKWSNCADLAKEKCYKDWVSTDCRKSCGKCKGMTPAASNTCYDVFGNCEELAKTNCKKYASQCKKSCGLCEGMTPHKSNTCYDSYTNCASVCSWYTGSECNLACGKC